VTVLLTALLLPGGAREAAAPRIQHGAGAGSLTPSRPSSVRLAARKLCTAPSLIASTGSRGFTIADHVRGVVFGGMDGILTTFALIAAASGSGSTSPHLTLVIGISTVIADAFSMAAGEYLSAKAEEELLPQGKRPADEPHPLEKGFAMFVAFTLFGSTPLLGYVVTALLAHETTAANSFQLSIAITASALFALGTLKTTFGAGVWWKSGLEVSAIGGAAASVAFYTAQLIEHIMSPSL